MTGSGAGNRSDVTPRGRQMTNEATFRERPERPLPLYLGLGANVGRRAESIAAALELLDEVEGLSLRDTSSVYETLPVGVTDQPIFLNMVAHFSCAISPAELLEAIGRVEEQMGRVRAVRWGPRTIDIDVLLLGDLQIDEPSLTIPHPEMTSRQFVLVPLAEIAPDVVLPGGLTAAEMADPTDEGVRSIGSLGDVLARGARTREQRPGGGL